MKKQLTQQQLADRDERRRKFRALVKRIADMPESERQALCALGIATVDGHALSFKNTMLVALQLPHASIVAGFRQWLRAGRSVTKGQHGATIWIPTGPKSESAEPSEAEIEAGGGPRFITGTVFDISQTQDAGAVEQSEPEAVAVA